VGAFVGEGTLVDSHALVGSCAQFGARVHLSAAAQIGGVLEPVGARAVVVPGQRPAKSDWARERGLGVACALITKYRDERTDRATALEEALR
jgi:tetrahydrodipicolinate N-succinyltransferase